MLAGTQVAFQIPDPVYTVEMVSLSGGLISTSPAGIRLETMVVSDIAEGPIDILIVAGGENAAEISVDPSHCKAIRALACRADKVASICTGAFLLAAAELLKNRNATTHWNWAAKLALDYPDINVNADKIFVQDGHFFPLLE